MKLVIHDRIPPSPLPLGAGDALVAIDVLRASTTLAAALWAGARSVLAVGDLETARREAERLGPGTLLAGERQCLPPPGFDLGNSPLEMTPERLEGRLLVATTTNGTRALLAGASARWLFLGALVNLSATVRCLLAHRPDRVHLLCAGVDGEPSEDDWAVAGAFAVALAEGIDLHPEDPVAAKAMARSTDANWGDLLASSGPGRRLAALGLAADIAFAAQRDRLPRAILGRPAPEGIWLQFAP